MRIITCGDLAQLGAWKLEGCCGHCHARACDDDFVMEIGPDARLELCCNAGVGVGLTGEQFARLLSAEAPAAPLPSP